MKTTDNDNYSMKSIKRAYAEKTKLHYNSILFHVDRCSD